MASVKRGLSLLLMKRRLRSDLIDVRLGWWARESYRLPRPGTGGSGWPRILCIRGCALERVWRVGLICLLQYIYYMLEIFWIVGFLLLAYWHLIVMSFLISLRSCLSLNLWSGEVLEMTVVRAGPVPCRERRVGREVTFLLTGHACLCSGDLVVVVTRGN